jgi:hypothetical protein
VSNSTLRYWSQAMIMLEARSFPIQRSLINGKQQRSQHNYNRGQSSFITVKFTNEAVVQDKVTKVKPNLYGASRHLRKEDQIVALRVDAQCIN